MIQRMPDDAFELLNELIKRTTAGDVQWQSAGDGTTFVLTTPSGSVSIESVDGDGNHPYLLSFLTTDGVRADSWSSVERGNGEFEFAPYGPAVGELYDVARRNAQGSTQLIRGLLRDIRKGDIPF
jgi:hypothetical protein